MTAVCCYVCIVAWVPAEMLIWQKLSLSVQGDLPSQERSITTSDMCQVYYVRGFIELIYSVAVGFNQGQFMHSGWADEGGGSTSERKQLYSERNSAA